MREEDANGAALSQAPEYFCNKCGYFGPVEFPHQRPNGIGKCGYMAVLMKPADGVAVGQQPWAVKVHCSKGERTLRAGMQWTDSLHGGTWEVVEPSGKRIYSPSGLGGTPEFWCKHVSGPTNYRDCARDDGCVEFCGDSIAAQLVAAGVKGTLNDQQEQPR